MCHQSITKCREFTWLPQAGRTIYSDLARCFSQSKCFSYRYLIIIAFVALATIIFFIGRSVFFLLDRTMLS